MAGKMISEEVVRNALQKHTLRISEAADDVAHKLLVDLGLEPARARVEPRLMSRAELAEELQAQPCTCVYCSSLADNARAEEPKSGAV